MTITSIIPSIEPTVAKVIEEASAGEDLFWDLSTTLHPQHGTIGVLTIWMRGGDLGTWNSQIILIVNPIDWAKDPERLAPEPIREGLEGLRAARSQQLAEAQNPPSGLSQALQGGSGPSGG